jgi:hypothetical protein
VQSLDMSEASSALDQLPAKFKELTGLDLDAVLHSLDGEFGFFLTLDPHKTITLPIGATPLDIPSPGLCLVFKVNSNLIFDRVDQIVKGNPLVTKVEEPDLKMRTLTIPLPIPVDARPSLARVGDYLLLASSDNLVREIIAVKSGQKKGYKTTDEFKRLSQGVPGEGNNFTLVSGAFGSTVAQIQEKSMAGQNLDPEALKTFEQLLQKATNSGSYSVGANGPDGWEGIGNGSQGGQGVLVLPAVAVAAIGAAIALPAFAKARTTSQEITCINNLRMIDAAKQQWALENKKQSGDTPTMNDLLPFLGRGAKGEAPVCPSGGDYSVGSVGEKPTCSHPGHVLP